MEEVLHGGRGKIGGEAECDGGNCVTITVLFFIYSTYVSVARRYRACRFHTAMRARMVNKMSREYDF